MISGTATNPPSNYNPVNGNIALMAAIVGDTEQFGTRRASIGRETYLPPGATLVVTNLYWTSPAMTQSNASTSQPSN